MNKRTPAMVWIQLVLLGLVSHATHSAEITTSSDDKNNITYIRIEGDINTGDEQTFMNLALPLEDAVVMSQAVAQQKTISLQPIGTPVRQREASRPRI